MTLSAALVSLLISLGIITPTTDLNNLSQAQTEQIEQIIIEDNHGL